MKKAAVVGVDLRSPLGVAGPATRKRLRSVGRGPLPGFLPALFWSGVLPEMPVLLRANHCPRFPADDAEFGTFRHRVLPLWLMENLMVSPRAAQLRIAGCAGAPGLPIREWLEGAGAELLAAPMGNTPLPDLAVWTLSNTTSEETQEFILKALPVPHSRIRLLWRPIAAVLGTFAPPRRGPIRGRPGWPGISEIWVFDLGWANCALTRLRVDQKRSREARQPVPVRELPDASSHCEADFSPLGVAAAAHLFAKAGFTADAAVIAHAAEASPLLHPEVPHNGVVLLPDGRGWRVLHRDHSLLREAFRSALFSDSDPPGSDGACFKNMVEGASWATTPCFPEVLPRFVERLGQIVTEGHPLVLCGPVADKLIPLFGSAMAFWEVLLGRARVDPEAFRLFHSPGALASGARQFGERTLAGETTVYFDTLPALSIRVVARRLGEHPKVGFEPLIRSDLVPGGQRWETPKPIEGFSVAQDSREFSIDLRRNEEPFVRRLPVRLPMRVESETPVRIAASIRPAAGHARVVIEPIGDTAVFGRRGALVMDWDRMELINSADVDLRVTNRWGYPVLVRDLSHEKPDFSWRHFPETYPDDKEALCELVIGLGERGTNPLRGRTRTSIQATKEAFGTLFAELKSIADSPFLLASYFSKLCKTCGFFMVEAPVPFRRWLMERLLLESPSQAEILAAGRTFRSGEEFGILVQGLKREFRRKNTEMSGWWWWAVFRSLSRFPHTVQTPVAVAADLFGVMKDYFRRHAPNRHSYSRGPNAPYNRLKFALCAFLFALRFREIYPDKFARSEEVIDTLASTIERMATVLEIPPAMLPAHLRNAPLTFNRLAVTFAREEASDEDRALLEGISKQI